jgi:hypothetical protein
MVSKFGCNNLTWITPQGINGFPVSASDVNTTQLLFDFDYIKSIYNK